MRVIIIMDTRSQKEYPNEQFVPNASAIPLFLQRERTKNYQNRMENDEQWTRYVLRKKCIWHAHAHASHVLPIFENV